MTIHFTCSICGKTSSMDLKSMSDFFRQMSGSTLCHLGQHETPGGQLEHLRNIYVNPVPSGFHPYVENPHEGFLLAEGVPLRIRVKDSMFPSVYSDYDIQDLLDPSIKDHIERQLALGGISWE